MGKGAKESSVKKVLKQPVMRLLVKARDFYINGMSQLSNHMWYGVVATMGCPAHTGTAALPRSFSIGVGSTNSSSGYSKLTRTASARDNLGNRSVSQKQGPTAAKGSSGLVGVRGRAGKVPRSYSIGLGRIEEEESQDLVEDYTFSNSAFSTGRRRGNS